MNEALSPSLTLLTLLMSFSLSLAQKDLLR